MSAQQHGINRRRHRDGVEHNSPPPRVAVVDNPKRHSDNRTSSSTHTSQRSESQQCAVAVVEWDGASARCERKDLSTPDELRTFLEGSRDVGARGAFATTAAVSEGAGSRKPLVILRGPAPGFVEVLLAADIGIDPAFVAAHAARRRYKPPRQRGRSGKADRCAQWAYPELVSGLNETLWEGVSDLIPVDAQGISLVRGVSDKEDLASVECRASIWVAERVDVLFLDRSVWEEPGTLLRKSRRTSGGKEKPDWDVPDSDDEGLLGLEDVLQKTLSSSQEAEGVDLVDIVEEITHDKWLDFFDVLTPRQEPLILDGTSLEWRALQALENNTDQAKALTRHRARAETDGPPNWPALLQRLRDRIALLPTIPTKPQTHQTDHTTPTRPEDSPPPTTADDQLNQRALDRVTYLGGLLLPTSLVASILSMNAQFVPGQALFWVFWAAAVPLTLLTLVVIYADKLRRAEVWVEVAAAGAPGKRRRRQDELASGTNRLWDGKSHDLAAAPAPTEAVAYAAVDDVVVDLSGRLQQARPPTKGDSARRSSQQSDDDDDDVVVSPEETQPAPAWRKKQLGWGGAAMTILRMRKPLRVDDGLPPGPRRGRG